MAKKPAYPTKSCPKCGKPIHSRLQSHEACGWTMNGKPEPSSKGSSAVQKGGGITVEDIAAVKKLVDQIGAEKVRDVAKVLAK